MDFSSLLKKKKDPMSEVEKKAKMSVLGDLQSQASSALGDKLRGLKKVTVAAPDKKGLELGLDKAKELTGDESGEDASEEASESPEMEASEEHSEEKPEEEMSVEELDKKIQELEALKKAKLMSAEG